MNKEIFATMLLVSMLSLTLYNIHYLDGVLTAVTEHVDTSETHAKNEDYTAAVDELLRGIDEWEDASHYASILLRHTDIEDTSGVFYDLLSDLYAQDGHRAKASYQKLRAHLHGISEMERVTIYSIF